MKPTAAELSSCSVLFLTFNKKRVQMLIQFVFI